MKRLFYLFLILITLLSCNEDESCDGIDCFTPPQEFLFQILDKDTEENLIANGTFDSSQIIVKDYTTGKNIEFDFISENDSNILVLNTIGWKTEIVNYTIEIAEQVKFNFIADTKREFENCCSFTTINSFSIENIDYEIFEPTGLIKILVDESSVKTKQFKVDVRLRKDYGHDLIYTFIYNIDDYGMVFSRKYENKDSPEYNNFDIYKYDESNKLIKVIRNNETKYLIVWEEDLAIMYNAENQKYGEFLFNQNNLVLYRIGFDKEEIYEREFRFDLNGNALTKSLPGETLIDEMVEYLDYDLNKQNPEFLLKSIEILKFSDGNPITKNIFKIVKHPAFVGDDYSKPLTYYEYHYDFDEEGRIISQWNDISRIYVTEYNY